MNPVKAIIRVLSGSLKKIDNWSKDTTHIEDPVTEKKSIYTDTNSVQEVHSVWDFLAFKENTQAYHITAVVGFHEWVSMKEIRRRIKELFSVEYKNDRSLYPYIKTLVDTGLLETLDIEGIRKWRKRDIFIKIGDKPKKEDEKIAIAQPIQTKNNFYT